MVLAQYMASPIQYDTPDVLGALASGYSSGAGIREDIRNVKKRAEAEAMTVPALEAYKSGDQGALSQIAQYNPELAKSLMGVEEFKQQGALNNLSMDMTRQQIAASKADISMQRELLNAKKSALFEQTRMQQMEAERQAQMLQEQEAMLEIRREYDVASRILQQVDKIEDPAQVSRFWDMSLKDAEEKAGLQIDEQFKGAYTPEKKAALQNMLMQVDAIYGFTQQDQAKTEGMGSKFAEDARLLAKDLGVPFAQAYALAKSGTGQGNYVDPDTGEVKPMAGYKEAVADTSQTIKAAEKIGQKLGESLVEKRDSAIMAQNSLKISDEAERLLDAGMFTGKFADLKLNAAKILGVSPDEIANTETFAAIMARSVGENISAFGSGTAISDADRAFVQKMVGGEISLDEKSLRKVIDINKKVSEKVISSYEQLRKNPASTELPTSRGVKENAPPSTSNDPIEAELKRRGLL